MADTYTQIYLHLVFAVEGRQSLVKPEHNDELQKYITGVISGRNQKLLAINNMPDHLHLLIGLKPDIALSDLVRDVKAGSSRFVNEKHWVIGRFGWQEGFGAFSYSRSQIGTVIRYIENQQKHHATKSFRDEYIELLENSARSSTVGIYLKPPPNDGGLIFQNMPLLTELKIYLDGGTTKMPLLAELPMRFNVAQCRDDPIPEL
jgi:REP element-mobilizing transposase RayT